MRPASAPVFGRLVLGLSMALGAAACEPARHVVESGSSPLDAVLDGPLDSGDPAQGSDAPALNDAPPAADAGPTTDVNAPDAGPLQEGGGSPDGGGEGPDAVLPVDDTAPPLEDTAPPLEDTAPPADTAAPLADTAGPDTAGGDTALPDGAGPDVGYDAVGSAKCLANVPCITSFPYSDDATTVEGDSALQGYACAPGTNESGPEVVYAVIAPEAGFLSAAVSDGAGVDVDVHILSALDAGACLSRGDRHARADVPAGLVWVVVDTWVNSAGSPLAGDYHLDVGFIAPSAGVCALDTGIMKRVGDGGNYLAMPATGPVVLEAHLVTQDEKPPYPATATDKLAAHYALSQANTGLVMARSQVWAPLEGGTFYGAGIGSPTAFPTLHEGWYVNMYWTTESRPAKGTRMIARVPGTDRAVVVAAGYETGPGNLSHIGGTPEETHFYLGTGHLDTLTLGIATDQTLPLGPRRCTDP